MPLCLCKFNGQNWVWPGAWPSEHESASSVLRPSRYFRLFVLRFCFLSLFPSSQRELVLRKPVVRAISRAALCSDFSSCGPAVLHGGSACQ